MLEFKDIVDTGEEDWLLVLEMNGKPLTILVPKDIHPDGDTYGTYGLNLIYDGHYL